MATRGEALLNWFSRAKAGPIGKGKNMISIAGETYAVTLMIRDWPVNSHAGLLREYADFVSAKAPEVAIRFTTRMAPALIEFNTGMEWKTRRLRTNIRDAEARGENPRPEEVKAIKTIERFRDMRDYGSTGDLVTFDMWTFITLVGTDQQILRRLLLDLKNNLHANGIMTRELTYEQTTGFLQGMILAVPGVPDKEFYKRAKGRLVDDEAAATLYPGTYGDMSDGTGTYFGHRVLRGYYGPPAYLRHGADTGDGNILVIGSTGQGKSFFLKSLAMGFFLEGHRIFVFDVDGEWKRWCKAVGGIWVDQAGDSGRYMDPLWVPQPIGDEDYDKDRLNRTIGALLSVVALLAEGEDRKYPLDPVEMNAAERALMNLWHQAGVERKDPFTWINSEVNIRTWYQKLKEDSDPKAVSLVGKLWRYFEGLQSNIFANQEDNSTFENARVIVIHVSQTIDNDIDAHTAAVKMQLAQNMVWHNVARERILGNCYTDVFYDEGQRVLLNALASKNINKLATAIRKYNGNLVLATNKPAVLWPTNTKGDMDHGGVGIWSNSSKKVFFWLEDSDMAAVERYSEMPPHILSTIRDLKKTNCYVLRGDAPGGSGHMYDVLKMNVPEEEKELYKTRGTKKQVAS